MRPLSEFPEADRRAIRGVFADIDDTLTTAGTLTSEAYVALERLHEAGFLCVPITGRPAGWCDHIARMWPVDAVVGENGAFYFRYDTNNQVLTKRFLLSEDERAGDRGPGSGRRFVSGNAEQQRGLGDPPHQRIGSGQCLHHVDGHFQRACRL